MNLAKTKKGRAVHAISHPYPGLDSTYEKMFNSARKNGWLNVALCGEYVQDPMVNPPEGPTCKDCLSKLAEPEYRMTPDEKRIVAWLEASCEYRECGSVRAAREYDRPAATCDPCSTAKCIRNGEHREDEVRGLRMP